MSVPSRGNVFTTADGTGMTFIMDGNPVVDQTTVSNGPVYIYPSGYLLFKDGTRYRIDGGKVSWIRDRNGNKISFTYDITSRVTSITDSLNRQVTVAYDQAEGGQYGTCDRITFKGFGGTPRYIRVCKSSLSAALRNTQSYDVTSPQTFAALFPQLNGSSSSTFNPTVVNSVWLPDSRRYQLFYNQYGELTRVVLPTGGAFEYEWAGGVNLLQIYRRVVERRVYSAGTSPENRTVYSVQGAGADSEVTVKQCKPSSGDIVGQCDVANLILTHSKHFFYGIATNAILISPTSYPRWTEGREYKTEIFDTNGTTILRRVENTSEQRAPVSWWTGSVDDAPPNDVRSKEVLTTLVETNQLSKTTFGYDDTVPFNNQNNVKEYDFGTTPGTVGSLIRETRTTFVTDSAYTGTNIHLRSLPLQVSIHDLGGTQRSRTTFEYDVYTQEGVDCEHSFHCLKARANVSGFCAVVTSPTSCDNSNPMSVVQRGNITGSTQYLLANDGSVTGSITAYAQYDVVGNVIRTIDPRSTLANIIATTLEYDDQFGSPDSEARSNTAPSNLGELSTYALRTKAINSLVIRHLLNLIITWVSQSMLRMQTEWFPVPILMTRWIDLR